MNAFYFAIILKDQRSGKIENKNFMSLANDYLSAWKEATEEAWAELNMHDRYWFIQSITHEI